MLIFCDADLATLSMRLPIKTVNRLYNVAIEKDRHVAVIVYKLIEAYLDEISTAPKSNTTKSGGTVSKPKRKEKVKAA
jgi:hypothetical protein